MTPAELIAIGNALWGTGWRRRMPEELGVTRQTVWKWETGKHPIPEIAVRFLNHLLAGKPSA